jgi:glyoxylate reductase
VAGPGGSPEPSARVRIFVTQPMPEPALARLREAGRVELNPDAEHVMLAAELREAVRRADVLVCFQHNDVDRSVIDANPALRLIASMAIEPASIDVRHATARGIPVTTIPPLVTEATADLHWGLLLAVARRIPESEQALRRGVFPGAQSMRFTGAEVHGKTLGIVGIGRVGKAIARRAAGFAMRVLYADRVRLAPPEEAELGVTHRPLDTLLAEADFVSVSVTLTPDTVHLIGPRELGLMRESAYLVNTSRGPVVDEQALADALRGGRIAGAALDVYEAEPRVEPALLELTNVVLTPHIGSGGRDTRLRIAHVVVDNVVAVLEGRRPPNLYNPEVWRDGAPA